MRDCSPNPLIWQTSPAPATGSAIAVAFQNERIAMCLVNLSHASFSDVGLRTSTVQQLILSSVTTDTVGHRGSSSKTDVEIDVHVLYTKCAVLKGIVKNILLKTELRQILITALSAASSSEVLMISICRHYVVVGICKKGSFITLYSVRNDE